MGDGALQQEGNLVEGYGNLLLGLWLILSAGWLARDCEQLKALCSHFKLMSLRECSSRRDSSQLRRVNISIVKWLQFTFSFS